jgi:hypothetical protein
MHAIAVELDLVQPLRAFRDRVNQLRELRRDPSRKAVTPAPRQGYGTRHGGGTEGLPSQRTLSSSWSASPKMLGRAGELEADALAVLACRETLALDHRHLVRL